MQGYALLDMVGLHCVLEKTTTLSCRIRAFWGLPCDFAGREGKERRGGGGAPSQPTPRGIAVNSMIISVQSPRF